MIGGGRLALLLTVFAVLVPVTDPRGPGNSQSSISRVVRSPKSESCTAECGGFPKGGETHKLRCKEKSTDKYCHALCHLICKEKMRPSMRKRMTFRCVKGKWHSNTNYHCIADNFFVKEVQQSPIASGKTNGTENKDLMNELIKKLLWSSYEFVAMTSFYERADVALPGFKKLMAGLHEKDMKFAHEIISYQAERGESLCLHKIERPSSYEELLMPINKRSGKAGLAKAIAETKSLNAFVSKIVEVADAHRRHFLEDGLLEYKINTIKKLADLFYALEKLENDDDYYIGEYSMDLELRE